MFHWNHWNQIIVYLLIPSYKHWYLHPSIQGYLFVSVIIGESHDLTQLINQSIRHDLESSTPVFNTLAMQCIANIASKDMAEQLAKDIPPLLTSQWVICTMVTLLMCTYAWMNARGLFWMKEKHLSSSQMLLPDICFALKQWIILQYWCSYTHSPHVNSILHRTQSLYTCTCDWYD